MDLHNVPDGTDLRELKRLTGAKHIIESELQEDHLKGTLTGTGRVKIRLNRDESVDKVKANLRKAGIGSNVHNIKPGKNPKVTQKSNLELR